MELRNFVMSFWAWLPMRILLYLGGWDVTPGRRCLVAMKGRAIHFYYFR